MEFISESSIEDFFFIFLLETNLSVLCEKIVSMDYGDVDFLFQNVYMKLWTSNSLNNAMNAHGSRTKTLCLKTKTWRWSYDYLL